MTLTEQQHRPLRMLSIDGGGVRGLTALLVLERIFESIKNEGSFPEMPKPCEYFDMIGGTSTGGLIAIMLGRLEMTIKECLYMFKTMSADIFAPSWKQTPGIKHISLIFGSSQFKAKDLEDAVKKLLREKGFSEDILLRDAMDPSCKVFVCVTRSHSIGSELLRSYETRDASQRNYDCCLWEAARATTAAPIFFDQISLQNGGYTFVDGGLRLNNPIFELIQEADRVYPTAMAIGCILSLGTGWTSVPSLDKAKLHNVLAACVQIALDSEATAERFMYDQRGEVLQKHGKYFRFNVEQGIHDIKLDEWKYLEKMDAMTTKYLSGKKTAEDIRSCAKSLLNPTPVSRSSRNPSRREEDSCQRFLPNTPHPYDTTSAAEETSQNPGAEKQSSETVDVDAILDKAVAMRGQPLMWRTSVVDLMKTLKLDSSLGARRKLAAKLQYHGDLHDNSYEMNVWLHKQIRKRLVENGGEVPNDLRV